MKRKRNLRHETQNLKKKSQNGDTLGLVELIVWPEQGNQGDWREQDDQGEVPIIIFGMSKSYVGLIRHFVCVLVFVIVFFIVFVLVIVTSWWFLNSFHHKLSEYLWL